jgi:xanthine dehydrogenase accessory factor
MSNCNLDVTLPGLGGMRAVWQAAAHAQGNDASAVLAIVLDTKGSTYAPRGACMLVRGTGNIGWLSGGCLEPEIAEHAARSASKRVLSVMLLDTRDDAALFSGHASGCRGQLLIALLPLVCLAPLAPLVDCWHAGNDLELQFDFSKPLAAVADVQLCSATQRQHRHFAFAAPPDAMEYLATSPSQTLCIAPPKRALVFGAGPETQPLLAQFRALGWHSTLIEARPRWQVLAKHADAHQALRPEDSACQQALDAADAVLIMHHQFELDLAALSACAAHILHAEENTQTHVRYVGLLGPEQRCADLMRLLKPAAQAALRPYLRSPIGLKLGGYGAAAIALASTAQLQEFWCADVPMKRSA